MKKLLEKLFGFSVTVHAVPDERYSVDLSGWICREIYHVVEKYFWIFSTSHVFMTKEAADKYKTYLENK